MRNYYDKYFYEKVSKDTLAAFVDEKIAFFLNLDRPDIQSENKEIGIEVTRGMTTYEGNAQSFFNQYFKRDNSTEFLINKMKKMKIKYGEIITFQGTNVRAFSPYSGLISMMKKKKQVGNSIVSKINSFKTYNKNFKSKRVYVFCGWVYELHDNKDIINFIENYYDIDILYFDCMDRIYIYNVRNRSLEVRLFQTEIYINILKEALDWRKGINA